MTINRTPPGAWLSCLSIYIAPPPVRSNAAYPSVLASLTASVSVEYLLARLQRWPSTPPRERTTQKERDAAGEGDFYKPAKIDSTEEQPMVHGRVHPAAAAAPSSTEPQDFSGEMNQSVTSAASSSPLYSFHLERPVPPPPPPPAQPGTYVVQVPRDKVFRVPPPENARLFEQYTRRAAGRRRCSFARVCAWTLAAVLALAVLVAAVVGVAYLAFGPARPAYAVQALAVSGLAGVGNASSAAAAAFSPAFDATVRADNRNGRIGVRYGGNGGASRVSVSYGGVPLADGAWPAFYQAPRNVTMFVARAKGAGLRLSQGVRAQMAAAERLRSVPFDVDVQVPVRMRLGRVESWAVPVRARCAVAVDRLSADAKVVSQSCSVKVRLLFWWS